MVRSSGEVTHLLARWWQGQPSALEASRLLVYDEPRRLACGYLCQERPERTRRATALVHETYLRLVDQSPVPWLYRTLWTGGEV